MAYLQPRPQEEQNTPSGIVQPQQGAVTTTAPPARAERTEAQQLVSGPGGTLAAGGTGVQAMPAGGSAPTGQMGARQTGRTGGVTDFQRILAANQPQTEGLAQRVGEGVQGEVTGRLESARDQALSTFEQRAEAPDVDQQLLDLVQNNPQAVVNNPTQSQQFRDILAGNVDIPDNFSGDTLAMLSSAYADAEQAGQRLMTPEGITETFARQTDRPAPGRDAFDTALLQTVPGAREYLENMGQTISNMGASTDQTVRQRMGEIAAREQQEVQDAATSTRQRFEQDVLPAFQQRLTDEATALQDRLLGERDALNTALGARGDLNDAQLAELGIDRDTYNNLRGYGDLNFQNYFRPVEDFAISPQQFATDEDYAYYSALQNLLGNEGSFLTDDSLAGQYSTDPTNYLTEDLLLGQRALDIQQATYGAFDDSDALQFGRDFTNQAGGADAAAEQAMDQLIRERNLDPSSPYELLMKDDARVQQLRNQGYVQGAEFARNNTNRVLMYKPTYPDQPTSLYDPATGETITPLTVAFPSLSGWGGSTRGGQPTTGLPGVLPPGRGGSQIFGGERPDNYEQIAETFFPDRRDDPVVRDAYDSAREAAENFDPRELGQSLQGLSEEQIRANINSYDPIAAVLAGLEAAQNRPSGNVYAGGSPTFDESAGGSVVPLNPPAPTPTANRGPTVNEIERQRRQREAELDALLNMSRIGGQTRNTGTTVTPSLR